MAVRLLLASTVITMDRDRSRAGAVLLDDATGMILAVGSADDCRAAVPADVAADDVEVVDLGDAVLAPGFIEPHSHPVLSGISTQPPAIWIAPYVGFPTWDDVAAEFRRADAETAPGQALLFTGLDRLLQGADELDRATLDGFFPERPVVILDNSGHEVYFNSGAIGVLGWPDGIAPPDPVGATYGRDADGRSDGRANELAAVMAVCGPVLKDAVPHPLQSAALWYAQMARNGITATSDMTYGTTSLPAYEALASVPDCPLRVSLYHMSTEPDADKPLHSRVPEALLRKQGIKLWADGSPWVGTAALSYPYLDNATVRGAGIPVGPSGTSTMNYSAEELDAIIDRFVGPGSEGHWQLSFHCNGDAGLDVVLDVYRRALDRHGLTGTDHRWRIEHLGGARADQFARVAELGAHPSMGPFQFIYWGDLLDGTLFPPEIGSQWMRFADAVDSGACVSFHNDGSVSPAIPLLNIQAAVTRRTPSGTLHGPEQRISLDAAWSAHTVAAARTLHRDHEIGSLEPGKLADLVELSADPAAVDPDRLTELVTVQGTWRGGRRIDLDAFVAEITAIDPTERQAHATALHAAPRHTC